MSSSTPRVGAARRESTLLAVDGGGLVKLTDLPSRAVLLNTRAHRDHARAAAISPDGRYFVSGAEDLVLWDLPSRSLITRLPYESVVWSAGFSPDSKTLVSTHGDGSVVLWDPDGRDRVALLGGHAAPVRAVAFSPDGRHVASGSEDRSVSIWDAVTGHLDAVLQGHGTRVMGVAYGGTRVFSCDQDGDVIAWDPEARRMVWKAPRAENVPSVCYGLSADPRGRYVIASASVLDGNTGVRLGPFGDSLNRPHNGVAVSADGTRVAGAG
jgi:WD40 repeat protein